MVTHNHSSKYTHTRLRRTSSAEAQRSAHGDSDEKATVYITHWTVFASLSGYRRAGRSAIHGTLATMTPKKKIKEVCAHWKSCTCARNRGEREMGKKRGGVLTAAQHRDLVFMGHSRMRGNTHTHQYGDICRDDGVRRWGDKGRVEARDKVCSLGVP